MASVNKQVTFQVPGGDDDEEYELTVVSYSPPTADTRDEPGDGGEIDFSPTVSRLMCGRKAEEVPFDEFIGRVATHQGITHERAESFVRDRVMFDVADMLDADFEDSLESFLEDV